MYKAPYNDQTPRQTRRREYPSPNPRTDPGLYSKVSARPPLGSSARGSDPASIIYTRKKGETAVALGMEHETLTLPHSSTPDEVKAVIDRLNLDPRVDGVLIQRPLPRGFKEEEVLYWVAPEKDVDAFHPINAGKLFLGLPASALHSRRNYGDAQTLSN